MFFLAGWSKLAGAAALLVPALSGAGALVLTGVMAGAVATHVLKIGGSPLAAIVLLAVTAIVAWGRRERTLRLFRI
jgi:putative oxidoreductase